MTRKVPARGYFIMKLITTIVITLLFASSARAVITDPVLWLRFDEGTGSTTTADSSGLGNIGTMNGTLTWQAGRVGLFSLQADGSTGYVSTSVSQVNSLTAVSVSGWVNRTSGTKCMFGFNSGTSNTVRAVWYSDDRIYFSCGNGVEFFPNCAAAVTGWHHVVVVYDASATPKQKIYLDGVNQTLSGGVTTDAGMSPTLGNAFWVGRDVGNGFAVGVYDDVRAYGHGLSATDVAQLYAYGRVSILAGHLFRMMGGR